METASKDVINFISEFRGIKVEKLNYDTRIGEDPGVDGDDAVELLQEYSKRFSVDITEFPYGDFLDQKLDLTLLHIYIINYVFGSLAINIKPFTFVT